MTYVSGKRRRKRQNDASPSYKIATVTNCILADHVPHVVSDLFRIVHRHICMYIHMSMYVLAPHLMIGYKLHRGCIGRVW